MRTTALPAITVTAAVLACTLSACSGGSQRGTHDIDRFFPGADACQEVAAPLPPGAKAERWCSDDAMVENYSGLLSSDPGSLRRQIRTLTFVEYPTATAVPTSPVLAGDVITNSDTVIWQGVSVHRVFYTADTLHVVWMSFTGYPYDVYADSGSGRCRSFRFNLIHPSPRERAALARQSGISTRDLNQYRRPGPEKPAASYG